jgi:hypothetical protein
MVVSMIQAKEIDGELWIKASDHHQAIKAALEAKDEPWEKFCDSHCVWTDHHPDCKLAKNEPVSQPKVRTGNCLRVGVCASEGHKIQPQRKPLTGKMFLRAAQASLSPEQYDHFEAMSKHQPDIYDRLAYSIGVQDE